MIAQRCGIDVGEMLQRQREIVADLAAGVAADVTGAAGVAGVAADEDDVVTLWRRENSEAALRFLDHLLETTFA